MDSEALQLLEDCEHRESRLSPWEATFVDSLRHQVECGKALTPTQLVKLNEVWDRVTGAG